MEKNRNGFQKRFQSETETTKPNISRTKTETETEKKNGFCFGFFSGKTPQKSTKTETEKPVFENEIEF